MDKKINADRLLRAMSDIDDKYIEEALEAHAPAGRAVTTSLRRYSGMIGAVAAALILVAAGAAVIKYMAASRSATATVPAHNDAVVSVDEEINMYSNDSVSAEQYSVAGGAEPADPAQTESDELLEGDLAERDAATYESLNFVYDSLDQLEESACFDFAVPQSAEGSSSRAYYCYFYDDGLTIAEVQYLDDDGNTVCTIRKAAGERNISGCVNCYSITERVEVDDIGPVNLSGSNSGYAVAYWSDGGYSYSVTTEDMIPQEDMLELVSQVN